ncbi:hypothetical protein FPY71_07285 [Aureimonas fodinaquatilis]|uniref:Uncharacterized protein n=1 Tax=Aureimonas fodinaquatilis TaxID=2565783 RepID=A0A5B0DXN4_9HYPH|nr:hypothetical protein [Aureimonas fodinaquatilis]KAA0970320.1 hypothetical protein FPY71_07285 [Aureimonas fodinaquatilis]
MAETIPAPPIVRGYAYAVRIAVEGSEPAFPQGSRLRAQVRRFTYSPVIADLDTSNGGLARVSDSTIEVRLTEAQTALIDGQSVMLDFVRTDVNPDAYQYLQIRLPVIMPVTRSA